VIGGREKGSVLFSYFEGFVIDNLFLLFLKHLKFVTSTDFNYSALKIKKIYFSDRIFESSFLVVG
jgi:hypothetical protein